jgi:hypothetical protein
MLQSGIVNTTTSEVTAASPIPCGERQRHCNSRSPIFIRNLARKSSNAIRMPNCGHPSFRDVTLTTQVVLLVDRMCGGAKLAA